MYYVYILRCAGNTLYTGISADIDRRMAEHFGQTEKCAKYTRSHRAEKLEACWQTENRSLASKLEYRIKQLTKLQKLRLIEDNAYLSQIVENPDSYLRQSSVTPAVSPTSRKFR